MDGRRRDVLGCEEGRGIWMRSKAMHLDASRAMQRKAKQGDAVECNGGRCVGTREAGAFGCETERCIRMRSEAMQLGGKQIERVCCRGDRGA
jgi:hypothetical protein